ncbi:hypothetical protein L7F22_036185 [Adiantum nelumboides]|nr:hypothetical protein [Adiantum nelumboides]
MRRKAREGKAARGEEEQIDRRGCEEGAGGESSKTRRGQEEGMQKRKAARGGFGHEEEGHEESGRGRQREGKVGRRGAGGEGSKERLLYRGGGESERWRIEGRGKTCSVTSKSIALLASISRPGWSMTGHDPTPYKRKYAGRKGLHTLMDILTSRDGMTPLGRVRRLIR